MKRRKLYGIISGLLVVLMVGACGKRNSSKEEYNEEIDKLGLAHEAASQSKILETKLFDGFRLGMAPHQVDSVFNIWVKEGKVVRFDEAGKTAASLISSYSTPSIETYAYRYDVGLPYTLDIMFQPSFLDDKLVSLYCSIVTPEENMNPKEVYKFLAESFEKSERGREFHKFEVNSEEFNGIIFIKDNLEIIFYSQPDKEGSSISYNNIPQMAEYEKQEKAKTDAARSL